MPFQSINTLKGHKLALKNTYHYYKKKSNRLKNYYFFKKIIKKYLCNL